MNWRVRRERLERGREGYRAKVESMCAFRPGRGPGSRSERGWPMGPGAPWKAGTVSAIMTDAQHG